MRVQISELAIGQKFTSNETYVVKSHVYEVKTLKVGRVEAQNRNSTIAFPDDIEVDLRSDGYTQRFAAQSGTFDRQIFANDKEWYDACMASAVSVLEDGQKCVKGEIYLKFFIDPKFGFAKLLNNPFP